MSDLEITISRIDSLIREGNIDKAQVELTELCRLKLPRPQIIEVAALCRRNSQPVLAIRLLNPIVRTTGKQAAAATIAEKAEYAASLTYIGAAEEALNILKSLDASSEPQVCLFTAFAYFAQWDYAAAIPLLEQYCALSNITPYQKVIGQTNLAAAYVHERNARGADSLLNHVLKETARNNWKFLHRDALHLLAEHQLLNKDFSSARDTLHKAEFFLKQSEDLNTFYLHKWSAILELNEKGPTAETLKVLNTFRREAVAKQNWEACRDCDRFEALARRDEVLLIRVYYGTPFHSYRERLLKDWGTSSVIPDSYVWHVNDKKTIGPVFDLLSGKRGPQGGRLKTGQVPERLLSLLCSDFYRAIRSATVFGCIFPDELYNPVVSPRRVHEAVRRLRLWLANQKVPLVIEEENGFYRLSTSKPCALLLHSKLTTQKGPLRLIQKLREHWPRSEFTVKDAAEALDLSSRTTLRLIKRAQLQGHLSMSGKLRTSKYQFKNK